MSEIYGIDVGTSFLKAASINLHELRLRQTERVPFPAFLPGPPGYREADPLSIARAVEDLLEKLGRNCPQPEAVLLCGQMHGVVLLDQKGTPISNYFSWLDGRVPQQAFDHMRDSLTEQEQSELGNEFRPNIALPLLAWMRETGTLPPGDVVPASIADFVASYLCKAPPILDGTQAGAFGALRVSTLQWHREVIGKLGLDALFWPDVRPIGAVVGMWRGVPCYAAVGDQQCALAGALLEERELAINIGTGSQVAAISGSAHADTSHQVRPYFDNKFLHTITHIPGGRALSALVALFTELGGVAEANAWPRIEAAVNAVPTTDLRADIAFYPGACGSAGYFQNLREGNLTIGHIFRSVFESMGGNYQECAHRLDPEGKLQKIVFVGGVARKVAAIRDATSAKLSLPFRLSPHPEDTLFGLMVLALAFRSGVSVQAAMENVRSHASASEE